MRLLLILVFLVTTIKDIAADETFCTYVNRGSFSGNLVSLTWWTKEVLNIAIEQRIYNFPVNLTVVPRNLIAFETDTVYFEDQIIDYWLEHPQMGYYRISPLNLADPIKITMNNEEMMVVQEVMDPANDMRLSSKWWMFWRKFIKVPSIYNQIRFSTWKYKNAPGIIHDMADKDVFGWVIDYHSNYHQTAIYSLWLRGNDWEYDETTYKYRYYVTFQKGHFVLYRNLGETPAKGSPFDKSPRGTVFRQTGTMIILDDDKGCVFTILAWNRTNIYEKYVGNELILKYKAFGTPYEEYFLCPDDYKPAANLDANRCNIEGPLTHSKTGGPDEVDSVERDAGRNGTFGVLLICGSIFLVALLAFGCIKGCSGKNKTTASTCGKVGDKSRCSTNNTISIGKSSCSGTSKTTAKMKTTSYKISK